MFSGRSLLAVPAALVVLVGSLTAAIATPPAQTPTPGAAVLCGHNERAVVHDIVPGRHGRTHQTMPFYVRNAYWKGTGESCVRTNGHASFTVLKTPTAANDVVAFPNIGRGCHWGYCTPQTRIPLPLRNIKSEYSYVSTANRPWGSWNKAYDIWFGTQREVQQHPDGAELMIWLDWHGHCCGLASDANRVHIDGKCFIRTYWQMHDRSTARHDHVHWNYIQYRLCQPRSSLHVNIADFIHDAERIGQIQRSWWEETVEFGFEEWYGGYFAHTVGGLRVNDFRLHLRTR